MKARSVMQHASLQPKVAVNVNSHGNGILRPLLLYQIWQSPLFVIRNEDALTEAHH